MVSAMMTSSPVERRQRKALGAFYSPGTLVEALVAWALRQPDQAVLDPSCGDGVFLEAAAERLRVLGATPRQAAALLHAVDLNPDAAAVTQARLSGRLGMAVPHVRVANFFSLSPPGALFGPAEGVDVILGNPPYIRYQEFSGKARRTALERAADAGVQLNQLASSWAHFVAHALAFLKPGGRLALILPAELIHTAYAAPLRAHLRASFAQVDVVSFREAVFPGVQEEVVLLLAAGKGAGPGRLRLAEIGAGEDPADMETILGRAEIFPPRMDPEKWLPAHAEHADAAAILDHLQGAGLLAPLGQMGKANIGFVSGANDFFVLTADEAREWSLPESSLRPALIRARQVPGLRLTHGEVALLRSRGDRCLLWTPGERLSRAEKAYVRHGEDLGYSERYKCRVRAPWYRVPGVVVPDAFLTYMSDVVPRLCINQARVVASNNLLNVRLPEIPAGLCSAFVLAFYNSATLLSCERIGRSYGGGVLKLEPREADRILVPALSLVRRHHKPLMKVADRIDAVLREGREGALEQAVAMVDGVLFADEEIDRVELANSRSLLNERRRARSRPARIL